MVASLDWEREEEGGGGRRDEGDKKRDRESASTLLGLTVLCSCLVSFI